MEEVTATLPNGQTITLNVPPGTSDEQIQKFVYDKYQEAMAPAPQADPEGAFREAMREKNESMGTLEGLAVGAGRTFDKWGAGIQNVFAGEQKKKRLAMREKLEDEMYATFQEDRPMTAMAGEIAPYLATGGLGGSSIAGQVGVGALQAGLTYSDQQGTDALVGGALSGAIPVAGKVFNAGRNMMRGGASAAANQVDDFTRVGQQLGLDDAPPSVGRSPVNIADQNKFPLTPGQRYDNRFLQMMESGMESNPLTGGMMHGVKTRQVQALNRMVAEEMGESGVKELSEEVLDSAATRIGREFDQLAEGASMIPDAQLLDDMAGAANEITEGLFDSTAGREALERLMAKIESGKPITSAEYQKMSSQISKRMRSPAVDGNDIQVLGKLKDGLDALVERNLSPDALPRFKLARRQWAALLQAQKMTNAGNISGPKLGNALQRQDAAGFMRGGNKSPLYDAGRLGQKYKPTIGDSGTAGRLAAMGLLGGGAYGAGSEGTADGSVSSGLAGAAMMALLPQVYLRGAGGVMAGAQGTKNLLANPAFQSLLGSAATGAYATREKEEPNVYR